MNFGIVGITQQRSLFGVLEQREDSDADHVGGGLVAGDQQTGAQLRGLLDADFARVDALGQVGDGILRASGGNRHLGLDEVDQILVEAHRPLLTVLGRGVAGQPDVGVVLEEFVVLVGDAEHVADHPGGHRQCELA